jgi:hypothetical protein
MKKKLPVRLLVFFTSLFLALSAFGQSPVTYEKLAQGFKNPPPTAQPIVYHWWLGGNVDTTRLKEEILSFKDAGLAGFTIFEIGSRDTDMIKNGPAFLGEESLENIKFAVDLAGSLGMEVGLNTASSWNAGGSWITPEHAAKSIYFTKTKIQGAKQHNLKLLFPEISAKDPRGRTRLIQYGRDGKPVFYKEIAVLAVPASTGNNLLDTAQIMDVSSFYNPKTERLEWSAPPGEWEIYRYVCSNSGENLIRPSQYSAGPIVDHFDADATAFHFNYIINRLRSVLGELSNTALKSLYMASYEAKGFTWTTTLPDAFKKINGYGVEKFLPALFSDSLFTAEAQANFQADYYRTLSELMINNFYKKSKEICNQHGLKNNSEAGGPGLPLHNVPVEPLKALGSLDIPRGEFWLKSHSRLNEQGIDILRVVKEVSAASHIYNRGIVEMEAFTTFQQWQEGPFEMKPIGDRAFCEGMNKVVIHGSTHNPEGTGVPGIAYAAGTHFNDKRVWWPKIRPFNEYLGRISYVLQETDFVADVLYYYGDTIPNYGGHKNSRFSAGPGYDYEIINTEILKEVTVKNRKLVLPGNGAQFSLLVLSEENEINPEVLQKVHELAEEGAAIIGPKPSGIVTRWNKDISVSERQIDQLWADRNAMLRDGKPKVFEGIKPAQMLQSMNVVPDFTYPDQDFYTLDYIHYAREELDFYLIRNTTAQWITRTCGFRQKNKVPEIWDPVSGEIVAVTIFDQDENYTQVPVSLAPYESLLLVFKKGQPQPQYTSVSGNSLHPPVIRHTQDGVFIWEEGIYNLAGPDSMKKVSNYVRTQALDGAWDVYFPEGWNIPEKVIFPKLASWTDMEDENIRYFSGIATYKKTFLVDIHSRAKEQQRIYLDLGDLSNVGEVWLNDQPLGITWTKPYRFDITEKLKAGYNTLTVEIANTWSNRIVGDTRTGKNHTATNITNTNIAGLNNQWIPWKDVPLLRSGLFGPVRLVTLEPLE